MKNKKIDFCIGIFDNLSERGLEKIEKEISNCEIFGIGVYTDDIVMKKFFTYPLNNLKRRMEIAQNIKGVKFIFPIDTNDPVKMREIIKKESMKFLNQSKI